MSNIFKEALVAKLRFASVKGSITTEQLFDLPLTSRNGFDLDSVAKAVNFELKQLAEESFVATTHSPEKAMTELALDVVKEIIADKLEAAARAAAAASKNVEKQKLLAILAKKTDEQLEGLSVEELQARIAAL